MAPTRWAGVLKYVTAKPKLGTVEAAGRIGVEDTKGGGSGWLTTGRRQPAGG